MTSEASPMVVDRERQGELPDRHALTEFLEGCLDEHGGSRVGLMLLEVEGIEHAGSGVTDDLMEQIAARGRRIVRVGDLFAGLGRHVFAVAWREADEAAQVGLVARVVMAMRSPFHLDAAGGQFDMYLDVVVGTAISERSTSAEGLLAKAERSLLVMNAARRHGLTLTPAEHQSATEAASAEGSHGTPTLQRPASLVVDLGGGRLRHADDEAERLFGEPRAHLIGRHVAQLLDPSAATGFHLAFAAVCAGAVESFRGRCSIVRSGRPVEVWASVRVIQSRDDRIGVLTMVPADATGAALVGGEAPFWRRDIELALGFVGNDLIIAGASISEERAEAADVRLRSRDVIDESQCVGASLLSFVHTGDAEAVRDAHAVALSGRHATATAVRWFHPAGGWFEAELVLFATGSPRTSDSIAFVLIERHTAAVVDESEDRVVRLERLLAHIASEARSAANDAVDETAHDRIDWSRLAVLSARQREVVRRLVTGERVPAIAKAMFISRSTVRNHLSSAFHLCGVKTQSELIELFLAARSDSTAA